MVPRGRRLKRAHYAPVSSRRIYACRRGMRHFATRILEHRPSPGGGKDSVMSRYSALLMLAAAFLAMSPALAQQDEAADYPNRPVKIVVSVPAGAGHYFAPDRRTFHEADRHQDVACPLSRDRTGAQ